ncbi:MAG: hypothetical protein K0R28_1835 [Paenibacillus sp.]|nr:hypothetical protein [Paenibacillus sp.]
MILWMKYNLESTWATFLFGGLTMARDYLVEGALKGLGYQPFMDRGVRLASKHCLINNIWNCPVESIIR